jgi:hypothetical protein
MPGQLQQPNLPIFPILLDFPSSQMARSPLFAIYARIEVDIPLTPGPPGCGNLLSNLKSKVCPTPVATARFCALTSLL